MKINSMALEYEARALAVRFENDMPPDVRAQAARLLLDLLPTHSTRAGLAQAINAGGRDRYPSLGYHFSGLTGGHHVALHLRARRDGRDLGRVALITSPAEPDWP